MTLSGTDSVLVVLCTLGARSSGFHGLMGYKAIKVTLRDLCVRFFDGLRVFLGLGFGVLGLVGLKISTDHFHFVIMHTPRGHLKFQTITTYTSTFNSPKYPAKPT